MIPLKQAQQGRPGLRHGREPPASSIQRTAKTCGTHQSTTSASNCREQRIATTSAAAAAALWALSGLSRRRGWRWAGWRRRLPPGGGGGGAGGGPPPGGGGGGAGSPALFHRGSLFRSFRMGGPRCGCWYGIGLVPVPLHQARLTCRPPVFHFAPPAMADRRSPRPPPPELGLGTLY